MKKDNILTIISVFLLASPLAVFFLNNGTYEQLLYLDAASGHNIKYTLLGVSTITIMYLVITDRTDITFQLNMVQIL